MSRRIDITGKRFGRLTVLKIVGCNKWREAMWLCRCDCGNEISVASNNLRRSHTQSCGCLQREATTKSNTTHGKRKTKLYSVWNTMKARCFNCNSKSYKDYGGRGIKVCDEWKNNFQAFYNYVSKLPHFCEEGYTLDRINNDGNYEPNNVRWATRKEQVHNRRKQRGNAL